MSKVNTTKNKTKEIRVRVSDEEYEIILKKANELGLTKSGYLRLKGLGGKEW